MSVWILLYNTGGYEGETSIEAVFLFPPKTDDIDRLVTNEVTNDTRYKDQHDRRWTILTRTHDNGWDGGYWVEEHEAIQAKDQL